MKFCIEVSDKNELPFQVITSKKMLEWYRGWSFFYVFDKQHEYFEAMIDHPKYKTSFYSKTTD